MSEQEEAMMKSLSLVGALLVVLGLPACQAAFNSQENSEVLADFADGFSLDRISTEGEARVSLSESGDVPALLSS